ncbi:MAG: hypothetical protein Ct9H90mP24_6580 [Methanobacteriota archaeon]|nr:MAG: hypothetical protein Ct9H90mP24_6580 [Euryarchaeota archaeon]
MVKITSLRFCLDAILDINSLVKSCLISITNGVESLSMDHLMIDSVAFLLSPSTRLI